MITEVELEPAGQSAAPVEWHDLHTRPAQFVEIGARKIARTDLVDDVRQDGNERW